MSNPFRDSSLWVRTVAFSAVILGVSIGLCGLNTAASSLLNSPIGSSGASNKLALHVWASPLLAITGIIEIGGMLIGVAGIALSVLAIFVQVFWRMATKRK